MTTAHDLLSALGCSNAGCQCQKSLKRGKGKTHCPGHSDTNPSLDVAELNGKVLFMCHGKCPDHAATLKALQEKGFFKKAAPKPAAKRTTAKRNQTRYVIRDTAGTPIAVHVREDIAAGDKRLWWETPDGSKGLGGIKPEDLLYGLELLAQKPDEPVVLTEGEKAADALRAVGVLALATVCGASATPTWKVLKHLAGRRVFLWPDADEPGHKHMERTGTRLHQIGCELFWIEWTEAPPKGDAADCPPDRLAPVIGAAERWEPEVPEDGAVLLSDAAAFLGRFVAFPSPEALDAAALWVAHAHGVEHFESTPRFALLSPEKQSGKTRTLEVFELLAPRARHTSNLTSAALFRLVAAEQPTILMDEADTYFRPGDQTHEELRGLVNAGHRKGAVAYRCVGQNQEVRAFPAYAAVALAGIGDLPDTVLDRAVLVKMRRRAPDEPVEPLRRRAVAPAAAALQARLAKWVEAKSAELQEAWPAMPDGLTDRPADCWEPLLAIADTAGGDWPQRARASALKLNDERQKADPSLGVRLLADTRTVFDTREKFDGGTADGIFTANLLAALVAMEEAPWGDLKGKPIDARGLARRLKPFGARPVTVGSGEGSAKGYRRPDFEDAWKRYLSPASPSQASQPSPQTQNPATDSSPATDSERREDAGGQPGNSPATDNIRRATDSSQADFEFNATAATAATANPESNPNGGIARLESEQDGDWTVWRLVGPKPSPGLFRSREAGAAWAQQHGWRVEP